MAHEAPIVTVCAWCPESEIVAALFKRDGFRVSHSICSSCVRLIDDIPIDPVETDPVATASETV